jgi:hypothetical protein
VDANEGLSASTMLVDANSPSLASTLVDANAPIKKLKKKIKMTISVHKKWTLMRDYQRRLCLSTLIVTH